jgi:lysophospholipase L1-like esterase
VHPDPIEGEHLRGLAAVPILIGTHTPIDGIILMLGTNDLKARFSVGPADIAAGIERLIEAIRAASIGPGRRMPRILVVAPPPILETGCLAEMFEGGEVKSTRLGSFLAQVARRCQVGFLDAGDHIQSSATDGIHFERTAHVTLAAAMLTAWLELLAAKD